MSKDWEEIIDSEYGEDENLPQDQEYSNDYLPDGMVTVTLGGADYGLFIADTYCADLSLLLQDEWTPEEAYRLQRLFAHLKSRRVVSRKIDGNTIERNAREDFLRDLRVREQTIAELHRQHLQQGGAKEYMEPMFVPVAVSRTAQPFSARRSAGRESKEEVSFFLCASDDAHGLNNQTGVEQTETVRSFLKVNLFRVDFEKGVGRKYLNISQNNAYQLKTLAGA